MFGGQALYAFQLDHQHVFDEDVSEVFPDVVAFVSYCKRGLTLGPDVTKGEFSEQTALIDLLYKTAPRVLETSKMAPSTRAVRESKSSAFIGVHPRPKFMCRH